MTKLTITIVNYNAGEFLLNCLESIKRVSREADITTYVVDNNSTDQSAEIAQKKFNDVNFIFNKENLGFGKAHNQVLKTIKEGFILILNPDVELEKDVLKTLLNFMEENKDVGATTCEVLLPDGTIDLTAHRGFPTPWASLRYFLGDDSLYHLSKQDLTKIHEVDAITGAFFLTKAEVLEKTGYFDEDYFMYAEDIDLCYRIKQSRFKIMYVPTVKILHNKGISTGLKKHSQHLTKASLETRQKMTRYFYQTMKIFYKKHYEKSYPFFINWLIYLAIDLKEFLARRKLTV